VIGVLAQRGSSHYLLQTSETECRVLDAREHRLFPPVSQASALARGYWEEFRGDETAVFEELTRAEDLANEDQLILDRPSGEHVGPAAGRGRLTR
jgi:hypothetical protein